MKNLTLNFYSEKQIIPLEKGYSSLKKSISEFYGLTLSDVDELEISYKKNEVKKIIKTEIDYTVFLHSLIFELNLEIKESSQLYKNSLEDLRKKNKDDLIKLSVLKKQKVENKRKQEKLNDETKKEIRDLNNQIKIINQKKLDYIKSIKKMMRGPRNKEKELTTKITKLGLEIKAPLVYNLTEGNELPVKGENEKENKYLELIQRNTECLKVQEQLYSTPRKNMAELDKKIKEINKQCFEIIKSSQKEVSKLKKEERNLILEIISLQKRLGIKKELNKPMIKTGFYIPNKLEIKPLEKEISNNSIKTTSENQIKLKSKNCINEIVNKKKVTRKMIRRKINHLKLKTRKKFQTIDKRINMIMDNMEENNSQLISEDKEFLEKTKQENKKAKNEIDEWLKFILSHTKELISAYEKKNDMSIEKLKEIEKKLGKFKKGETLIKSSESNFKKEHEGIYCNQCKENVVGIRYKCLVCNDFNFCERCEEKFNVEHGHPMLKINYPEMCPISINCSFTSDT